MKIYLLKILCIIGLSNSIMAQGVQNCDGLNHNVVIFDSSIVKLFSGGFFTESPTADDSGNIYFSDLTFTQETDFELGKIWRYSSELDSTIVFRSPSNMANGLWLNNDNLIVCEGADYGGRRIVTTNLKSGTSKILASVFNGYKFNSPNDLIMDQQGNVFFTDPRYIGDEPVEQNVMGVYQLSHDGNVSLLISDISMPNGIAISPDYKKIYIGCFDENIDDIATVSRMNIREYNLDEGRNVTLNRIIVEYNYPNGPDGLIVDEMGNLLVAVRDESNPYIGVYCSNGCLMNRIYLPEVPSNLCFGKNEYSNKLYITAGKSLYSVDRK